MYSKNTGGDLLLSVCTTIVAAYILTSCQPAPGTSSNKSGINRTLYIASEYQATPSGYQCTNSQAIVDNEQSCGGLKNVSAVQYTIAETVYSQTIESGKHYALGQKQLLGNLNKTIVLPMDDVTNNNVAKTPSEWNCTDCELVIDGSKFMLKNINGKAGNIFVQKLENGNIAQAYKSKLLLNSCMTIIETSGIGAYPHATGKMCGKSMINIDQLMAANGVAIYEVHLNNRI